MKGKHTRRSRGRRRFQIPNTFTVLVIFAITSTPNGQRSMQTPHSVQSEAFDDNASYSDVILSAILY